MLKPTTFELQYSFALTIYQLLLKIYPGLSIVASESSVLKCLRSWILCLVSFIRRLLLLLLDLT